MASLLTNRPRGPVLVFPNWPWLIRACTELSGPAEGAGLAGAASTAGPATSGAAGAAGPPGAAATVGPTTTGGSAGAASTVMMVSRKVVLVVAPSASVAVIVTSCDRLPAP